MMDNKLQHHGIKGQKWYQRRFQYRDGTLTDEGKKRYSKRGSSDGTSKKTLTAETKSAIKKGVAVTGALGATAVAVVLAKKALSLIHI